MKLGVCTVSVLLQVWAYAFNACFTHGFYERGNPDLVNEFKGYLVMIQLVTLKTAF